MICLLVKCLLFVMYVLSFDLCQSRIVFLPVLLFCQGMYVLHVLYTCLYEHVVRMNGKKPAKYCPAASIFMQKSLSLMLYMLSLM